MSMVVVITKFSFRPVFFECEWDTEGWSSDLPWPHLASSCLPGQKAKGRKQPVWAGGATPPLFVVHSGHVEADQQRTPLGLMTALFWLLQSCHLPLLRSQFVFLRFHQQHKSCSTFVWRHNDTVRSIFWRNISKLINWCTNTLLWENGLKLCLTIAIGICRRQIALQCACTGTSAVEKCTVLYCKNDNNAGGEGGGKGKGEKYLSRSHAVTLALVASFV